MAVVGVEEGRVRNVHVLAVWWWECEAGQPLPGFKFSSYAWHVMY